jgi:predicted branched-subunit amino acid permease
MIFSRLDFVAGVRDMTPPLIGLAPFGLVCGVGAQSAGASPWEALGLSALMFSGAAQILAAQLIAAGAPVAVTILTCVVVGLRFLMYSAAMAPHLKTLPTRWRHALAFLLTDQAFAAGIRRFRETGDTRNGASYFLGTGASRAIGLAMSFLSRGRSTSSFRCVSWRSSSPRSRMVPPGWPRLQRESRSWRSTLSPCGCR